MAKIVVVDDDTMVCALIVTVLEKDRHQIYQGENGVDAIRLVQQHQPDLLIIDILMPVKEGIETIFEIKPRFPAVKILTISNNGRLKVGSFMTIALHAGAHDVLAKPFTPAQLRNAVAALLDKQQDSLPPQQLSSSERGP